MNRKLTSAALGVTLAAGTILTGVAPASAHVSPTSYGTTYTAGATNVVYLRVPHGCPDVDSTTGNAARTSKVIVDIPSTVTSLKPEFRPGWTLAVVKSGAGAITQVTWTARSFDDALPDYSFADFGLRGRLNGVAGDKIGFTTRQECDFHDDGTAATGLFEDWIGVDTPTITLVATANKVAGSDDLASQRADVNASKTEVASLGTRMTAAETAVAAISGLSTRLSSTETRLSSTETRLAAERTARIAGESRVSFLTRALNAMSAKAGDVTATRSGTRVTVMTDLSSTRRNQRIDVKVNGFKVGSLTLNAAGDGAGIYSGPTAARFRPGANVTITAGSTTLASTTI